MAIKPLSRTVGLNEQRMRGKFVFSATFFTADLNFSGSLEVDRTAIMLSFSAVPIYSYVNSWVFFTLSNNSSSDISSVTSMAMAVGLKYVNSWRYITSLPPIAIAPSPAPIVTSLIAGFSISVSCL